MEGDANIHWQGHVTYEAAASVVEAGLDHALDLGVRIGISVVDAHGDLVAFARMDGVPGAVERGSTGKARFAASLGRSTGDFIEERLRHDEVLWRAMSASPDVFIVPGGFPLLGDGCPVGGVGVSGAKHEQDTEVARTAAESYGRR